MKLALALILLASPALAGTTADSESTSGAQSYSGVNIQQGNGYRGSPSMGAPSVMGDCGGASGAVSFPGFGISLGGGNGNRKCNLRADAAMLQALLGDRAAITHICRNDPQLRDTLIAIGVCAYAK